MGFWKSLRYMQSVLSAAIDPQLHALCARQGLKSGACMKWRMPQKQE